MPKSIDEQTLTQLTQMVREFAVTRDWDQFHSPRNLILALVGEVGELAAEVQWIDDLAMTEALSDTSRREAFEGELADIFNYLLRLADVTGVNLAAALLAKINVNEARYPSDRARGSSAKYTAYE